MSEVVALNASAEMSEFFQFIYGEQTGYVYAPTKAADGQFIQAYFQWPEQKAELISHCQQQTKTVEVYYGPALYNKPSGLREDIKGTHVFWAEFDGAIPPREALGDLPSPSRRIRSSENGHEHWYFRLDYFEVSTDTIERVNRGLAYQLGADTSGWDANQVLRPVGTLNHKRGKPVLTVFKNESTMSVDAFVSLPVAQDFVHDVVLENVPEPLDVIAKYDWPDDSFSFFRKKDIATGARSSALMRLGFYCAEMRMSDEEAYSIIANADQRWGKFVGRSDRKKRLLDIINKARHKYPLAPPTEADDEFPVFGFQSFLAADVHVEWVIPGFLQRAGYLLLSGPPGTGKTQISLRFAINMALGRDFLGWGSGGPIKVMFVSMEMGHADLKFFVEQMAEDFTDEEKLCLQGNLLLVPLGFGVMLDNLSEQAKVARLIDHHRPVGVFFDSMGSVSTDELSSEKTVKTIMDWNDRLRQRFDIFTWYIHHNRKAQVNNKKPNKLSDVYGNMYLTGRATTVIGLWPTSLGIEVASLKVRLSPQFPSFNIIRTSNLNFERSSPLLEAVKEAVEAESEENLDAEPDHFSL